MESKRVCLVTGGNGFVGQNLVSKLVSEGVWEVVIFDIAPEFRPNKEIQGVHKVSEGLVSGGVKYICGDLRKKEQVFAAVKGISVIFHVASPHSNANNAQLFKDVNVTGTQYLLDAAIEAGISKFVFTSSASVVFDGSDIRGGDETLPYPKKPLDYYTQTKAEAEQLVLKANGTNGLLTIAVRPSGIFGPGDPMLLPSMVALARAGKLKTIVGDGKNLWDFTYIDNVVHGHLCAEKALHKGSEAAGKAFFISNGEPYPFWTMTYDLMEGLGFPRHKLVLPAKPLLLLAILVSHLFSLLNKVLGPRLKKPLESAFTPSRIRMATVNRYYDITQAKKVLGYEAVVPLKEGIRRALEARPDFRKEVFDKEEFQSIDTPTRRALGGSSLADLLLWRYPLQSGGVFLAGLTLSWLVLWSSTSLVTLVSKALLWVFGVAFAAHLVTMGLGLIGRSVHIPDWESLQLSDRTASSLVRKAADAFNTSAAYLHRTIHGKDVQAFAKIVGVLLLVRWLGSLCELRTLLTAAFVLAFLLPPFYQKYEKEISEVWQQATEQGRVLSARVQEKLPPALQGKVRRD